MLLDLRYALRTMRRNPGYALTGMICLALAMGVNATLFSLLNSMLFRKLPVPEAGRIVQIHRERTQVCGWRDFLGFRDHLQSLRVAAWLPAGIYADVDGANVEVRFEMVSANYAGVLRLAAYRGRWFVPEEDAPASEPAVVIAHRFWQTRLHGDPAAVGRLIRIQEQPFRIVGIAPPGYEGALPPWAVDAWVPQAALAAAFGTQGSDPRVNLVGRLHPGVTLERAAAELQALDLGPLNKDPLHVEWASGFAANGRKYLKPMLTLVIVVCVMVLLIACVNVANLLLSRAVSRRREMAIRQSLGAGRWRLFRAALAEGLILAAGSVALGTAAGYWTGRLLERALPSVPTSYYNGIRLALDWRVVLFLGAAGVASAVLFSLPPALENGRRDLNPANSKSRQGDVYSLLQVALSLALLIATGLLLRALHRAETGDPGFATDHRLYVNLLAPPNKFPPAQAAQLYSSLLEQARALPGVTEATLEFHSGGPGCVSASAVTPPRKLDGATVEPNYFAVLRVPIMQGAAFRSTGDTPEVVINETFARTLWPGERALGKTIWLGCQPAQRRIGQVAGIARDRNDRSLDGSPQPYVYLSRRQSPGGGPAHLIVRTAGSPYRWSKPLLQVAQRGGPNLLIFEVQSLEEASSRALWELKWQASLLGGVGLLAAVLAAIGLYGVVACSVSRRTHEIGVRTALGASPADVLRMVLGHGLRITTMGIAGGLLVSAGTVRLLRGFLYGMSPFDPLSFAAASIAWLAIAMLASWLPARRATKVDPGVALRVW